MFKQRSRHALPGVLILLPVTLLSAGSAQASSTNETQSAVVISISPITVSALLDELPGNSAVAGRSLTDPIEILGGNGEWRGGVFGEANSLDTALSTFQETWSINRPDIELQVDTFRVSAADAARMESVLAEHVTSTSSVPFDTPIVAEPGSVRPMELPVAPAEDAFDVPHSGRFQALNQQGWAAFRHLLAGLGNDNSAYGGSFSTYAYEHDTKLQGSCSGSWWATRDAMLGWDTNLPGPYFDVDTDDECSVRDFTVGSYWANELNDSTLYEIDVMARLDGGSSSNARLTASALRIARERLDCNSNTPNPWCVGVDFPQPIGQNRSLISTTPFPVPGCYAWIYGSGYGSC